VPALFAASPIVLFLALIISGDTTFGGLVVWLMGTSGVSIVLEQIVRDRGSHKEATLRRRWGGSPFAKLVNQNMPAVDTGDLRRYLENVDEVFGTGLVKDTRPIDEDQCREALDSLRLATRDKKKFYLIHEENINYGFRRNLWALKAWGILLCVIFGLLSISCLYGWVKLQDVRIEYYFICLIYNAILLLVWSIMVNPRWVERAAVLYSLRLLEAIDTIKEERKKA
jgi:hypothetical protein